MPAIHLLKTFFDALRGLTVLIDVLRYAKVGAPVRANHAAGSLMRDRLVCHWISQALPLAVYAHIFGSIG